ncbi:SH3 domain-containing protein [Leptospira sp. 96542]|nr:SH3 domain-containing protein [Leptospira sp. 96542]
MANFVKTLIICIMISNCFTKSETKKSEIKQKLKVWIYSMGDGVNIRSEPSLDSSILLKLNQGDECELIDKNGPEGIFENKKGNWYKVKKDDKTGWVFNVFLVTFLPYSKFCYDDNTLPVFQGKISYPSEFFEVSGLYLVNIKTNQKIDVPIGRKINNLGEFEISVKPGKYFIYALTGSSRPKDYITYCSNISDLIFLKNPYCNKIVIFDAKLGCRFENIDKLDYYSDGEPRF